MKRCGAELHWIFDRVAAVSSWSCTAGCAGPAAPPYAAAPPPEAPHAAEALPHDAPAATSPGASRPAAAFWLTRGPPLGVVADSTNSWLYVPLLHAAASDLAPTALEAWRADPRATDWWEQARQLLAASAPVAPQTLIAALARTAETAPAHAHHLPDVVARIHEAGLPNGSLVHAGWAVRQLREPDGYLLAPAQEVLLECFGGHALAAALDRHSDRFRPSQLMLSVRLTTFRVARCSEHSDASSTRSSPSLGSSTPLRASTRGAMTMGARTR